MVRTERFSTCGLENMVIRSSAYDVRPFARRAIGSAEDDRRGKSRARRTESSCSGEALADAVAVAKRGIRAGEVFDGESGYTIRGEAAADGGVGDAGLRPAHWPGAWRAAGARRGALSFRDVRIEENAAVALHREALEVRAPG